MPDCKELLTICSTSVTIEPLYSI